MKKTQALFFAGAVIVAALIFLSNQAMAADAQLVKVQPEMKGDQIKGLYADPPILYVKKDAIVVWMSGIPNQEVQIVFTDGKTCRDVTANPNDKFPGFYMDASSCYVTSFLPYCATSTLQFPEAGKFKYKVVTVDGKMASDGEINVKE
jgi:hypothetical protein